MVIVVFPLFTTNPPSRRILFWKVCATEKVFVAVIVWVPFKFTAVPLTLLIGIEPTGNTGVPVNFLTPVIVCAVAKSKNVVLLMPILAIELLGTEILPENTVLFNAWS